MEAKISVGEQKYKMLFSPMKIGTCEIKNRIVMPPMMVGFGQPDGRPTEMLMDYYEERAKGGTGLIITEITRVNDDHGAAAFNQLAMSHDYHIEPMREMANRIKRHGAKLFVQLHHPGRQNIGIMVHMVPLTNFCSKICKNFPKLVYKMAPGIGKKMIAKGLVFASPGPSKCEPSKVAGGHVRGFSHREVKQLIRQFIDAAVRCKKAGVDGVELHAAHGYLLQQFLSPNTNKRTDEYGGSFENRLRFVVEILKGIKEACGKDYPVIVRLAVDECYDKIGQPGKGYGLDTGVKYAVALKEAGADAIDVSSAAYDTYNYWLEPTSFDCGWRAYMAEAVKKAVGDLPVLAANVIRSAAQAERQIESGMQDFAVFGRPHIADPHLAEKMRDGREDEVKRCISCLYCIESMMDNAFVGKHGCCSVNPSLGEERRYNELPADGKGRKVIVVGAGVAGLTAAEILAGKRGFAVTVYEKESITGGQINLADKGPKKEKIGWCAQDLFTAATKAGAKIVCGVTVTPELIEKENPYAVIIATGAVAVRPRSIKGSDGANVFTTTQILDGSVKLENKKVAVVGTGMTGLETGELLAEGGNKLTFVEMADSVAPGTWFQHLDDALPKLKAAGAEFILGTKLLSIDEKGIEVAGTKEKKPAPRHIDCDAVVLSLGSRPVNNLAKELEGKVERLFVVGDASKVGRIANATAAAYNVAVNLK